MGWTFEYHYGADKKYVKETLDSYYTWEKEDGTKIRLLKSTIVGSTYYGAVETVHPDGKRDVIAVVNLLSIRKDEWGYKGMDETMNPYRYDCPESILKLLTETDSDYANEWRAKCREYTKRKKALKGCSVGTKIKFPWGDRILVCEKQRAMYQFKTEWWLVVGEDYNGYRVKKKDIPVFDYRIVG